MGMLFMFAGGGTLIATLRALRGPGLAFLLGLTLLTTPGYLEYGVSQYADLPLAVYILCTVVLLCLYFEEPDTRRGLLVLAGFTTGCAGWTKNEGELFILATSSVLLLPALARPMPALRRFAAFFMGLAPPLAVIAFFKITIAPPGDFPGNRNYQELMGQVLNPDRYLTILASFGSHFWPFGGWIISPVIPLLVFIALRGIDRKAINGYGWATGVGALAIQLAGYYAVYVITPMELRWHIDSSLDRLLLQVWPSALLLAGLAVQASRPDAPI